MFLGVCDNSISSNTSQHFHDQSFLKHPQIPFNKPAASFNNTIPPRYGAGVFVKQCFSTNATSVKPHTKFTGQAIHEALPFFHLLNLKTIQIATTTTSATAKNLDLTIFLKTNAN
jgi:hypothetical protein